MATKTKKTTSARSKKKKKKTRKQSKYMWAPGARIRVSADIAVPELDRIAKKEKKLTADIVLESAKSKRSPLHNAFEWNDTKAAHQFRLEQARLMIRSYRIVIHDASSPTIRAFINVQQADEGSAYYPTVRVLNDKELHKKALAQACRLLNGVLRQYEHLNELESIRTELKKIQKQFLAK